MLHCLTSAPPARPLRPCPHTSPQDPQLLLARNGGRPPLTMQSFTKLVDAGE